MTLEEFFAVGRRELERRRRDPDAFYRGEFIAMMGVCIRQARAFGAPYEDLLAAFHKAWEDRCPKPDMPTF